MRRIVSRWCLGEPRAIALAGLVSLAGWAAMVGHGADAAASRKPAGPSQHHTDRARAAIERCGSESLEELKKNLSQEAQYALPAVEGPAKDEQADLLRLLSCRRALRLRDLVGAMAAGPRAALLAQLERDTWQEQRDTIDRIVRSYSDPAAPQNTRSLLGNRMAACASMWLSAQYGSAAGVLRQLDALDELRRRADERIAGEPKCPAAVGRLIARHTAPDNAFRLNVLMLALEKDPQCPRHRVVELRRALEDLPRKRVALTAWDAHPTQFDFVHVHEGFPIGRSKGVEELELYAWGRHLHDLAFQAQKVAAARDAVLSFGPAG